MCGIAGYLTEPGALPNRVTLSRMCDRLIHRGPDAAGYFLGREVALGHRRLSIIDVSGGDQPLGNEDGSIQVVFNGEIYNFVELRRDLMARNHRFATRSDTEVLVHLYEEVGERLPEYLNGMFAFAIWDQRREELFLARDRLGKKPLHYSFSVAGSRFCFASELKALTSLPGFKCQVNARSVVDFLNLSYVPDPDTIYENVHKLAPGHCLTVTRSGHRLRKYWEPRFATEPTGNLESSIAELRNLAADAVERRMISDVPLGGFLSGGVDSSAVVAFMARSAPTRVKTFSIGFTDATFDEAHYARLLAARYQTDHHEEVVSADIHATLATLARYYDEPFGDASAIPTLHLARMTRRYVTVALSGDGADELFGGYERYQLALVENRVRRMFPHWFRQTVVRFGARHYPALYAAPRAFRAKSMLTCISQQLSEGYFSMMSAFRDEGAGDVLAPDLLRSIRGYEPEGRFRALFESTKHLSPLQQLQAVDLQTYLPGDILVKVDRATMAYSLEARCPWLDYRVAELACSLPPAFNLRGNVGKYLFRKAVEPLLPSELTARRKMGFGVPLATWLRTSLKRTFETAVLTPEMEKYLSLTGVRKIWREHQAGSRNHDRKLWNLLILALWDRQHLTDSGVALASVGTTTSKH